MRKEDIVDLKSNGSWKKLEEQTLLIFKDLEKKYPGSFDIKSGNFALGGGTRLMLALDHRVSNDVDIFLSDAQFLSYFDPAHNDFVAESCDSYDVRTQYIKLRRLNTNDEIDFIVGPQLLKLPLEESPYSQFLLEPIAEVLVKKLFYRGHCLEHRDLFDWWAILSHSSALDNVNAEIAFNLKNKIEGIENSLHTLQTRYQVGQISKWNEIKTWMKPDFNDAIFVAAGHLNQLKKLIDNPHQNFRI